jgi:Cu/Ag efflux protein CusF
MKLRTKAAMAGLVLAGLGLATPGARAADYTEDMVKAVDPSNNRITLAHGTSMKVTDDCKVMMNGKSASMSDVKEGEKVRVGTSGKGDSQQVVEIWILQPGETATGSGSSGK